MMTLRYWFVPISFCTIRSSAFGWLDVSCSARRLMVLAALPASARPTPPALTVGTVTALRPPVEDTTEIVGRIQAIDKVDLSPRLTAFLERRLFTEGGEVKKRGTCSIASSRGRSWPTCRASRRRCSRSKPNSRTPIWYWSGPGACSARRPDRAPPSIRPRQRSRAGRAARRRQGPTSPAEINLTYTEIKAPIDGKIGRSAVAEGKVVGPNSGILAAIVSQSPIYVTFSVPVRTMLELQQQTAAKGRHLRQRLRPVRPHLAGQSRGRIV